MGVGGCLLQNEVPIAYTSTALTATQQRYAPIEKEFLTVAHSLEYFKYYTSGHPVIIQTDHKPLIGLMDKSCDKISP